MYFRHIELPIQLSILTHFDEIFDLRHTNDNEVTLVRLAAKLIYYKYEN